MFKSFQISKNVGKKIAKDSVQQLAARAAALATAEAAKNIVPSTSAYQFEASWRGFFGDRNLQARFLKVQIWALLFEYYKYNMKLAFMLIM